MYIAYLPKAKGENIKDRQLNNFLQFYIENSSNKYAIISSPGFMSKKDNTIKEYLAELSRIINKGYGKTPIGLLNGMNGHLIIDHSHISILEEHNRNLDINSFEQIVLKTNKNRDHRKMMCFFTYEGSHTMITSENINLFLQDIYIGAILIGSSNQSKTTYFNEIALQGESDVFMFDVSKDKNLKEKMDLLEEQEDYTLYPSEDIVITKSFHGKGHKNTQEFFKDILKNVLENGLE